MRRLGRILLSSSVALVSLVLAALLAEVCLRLLDRPPEIRSGWFNTHLAAEENQMRYRGQPIEYSDDDYVVVLVGDSQVEAKACSYHWMPERRLEHYLSEQTDRSVRVFTVGASGYGQDQELLALRRYLRRFRADHVVAWFTLNNDAKDNTWPTFMPIDGRPKPTFWLRDGELQGPNQLMGDLVSSPIRLKALFDLMARRSPDARWAEQYLPPPYEPLPEGSPGTEEGSVRTDWEELAAQGLLVTAGFRMEKNDRAVRLSPVSPRTEYSIALTRELLLAMRQEALAHGARFTLMAVDKGDKSEEIDGVYRIGGALYRASSEQFWQNIERITAGFDFHLLPVTEPIWQAGRLDHHLNEHATDQVMRDLVSRMAPGLAADAATAGE